MTIRVRAVVLAAAAALLAAVAEVGTARAELLVGAGVPVTGQYAWNGEPTEGGIRQAVVDLNAAGGLLGEQLRVVVADDYCDPQQATAAARKLVADGVRVVVGHQCSDAAIAAAPVYEAAGIVLLSNFATNPELTERGLRLVFRVIGRDDRQAEIAAAYLVERFAGKRVAILHDTRRYGRGLAEEARRHLRERGVKEVLFAALEPGVATYPDIVRQMQELGVEVIYYGGYQDEGGLLRRQSWEAGLQVPMLTGDGITANDYWLIAGPEAAAATLSTSAPDARERPEAAALVTALQAVGQEPQPAALHAYAAVQVWAQAVRAAGTTEGHEVAEALRAGSFSTVIGEIGFDEKGDLVGPAATFVWYTWRDGTHVSLEGEPVTR
jgi:branched-chain amino acid transport system substrate-binding protein